MPCTSTTLGAGDRRELIDRELDGLLAADLQIPFVVGEHESPAEAAADDEGKRDTVRIVRGHGAVAEGAVLVVVDLSFPAAKRTSFKHIHRAGHRRGAALAPEKPASR